MDKGNSPSSVCESCKVRPRARRRQAEHLLGMRRFVERDRRMRAERAALRGDKLIRAKLRVLNCERSAASGWLERASGVGRSQAKGANPIRFRKIWSAEDGWLSLGTLWQRPTNG